MWESILVNQGVLEASHIDVVTAARSQEGKITSRTGVSSNMDRLLPLLGLASFGNTKHKNLSRTSGFPLLF